MVGAHCKGLAPSRFILFRSLSHSFPKVLKNEPVGVVGVLVVSQSPLESKCLTSLPK